MPDASEEAAMEIHVAIARSAPEREVLGIERSAGEDGSIAEPRPVDAVGRLEGVQPLLAGPADRLVAGIRLAAGIGVDKRREVVRADVLPDDVVVLGAVELEQAEFGLGPVESK